VGLSDDLQKLDQYVEGVTRKVANYLRDVLEDQRDKLAENLLANNSNAMLKIINTKVNVQFAIY
jgi:V-type H+-transporting ATPase subunit C